MKYYLILDIGGTKTTSVVFNEKGEPVTEFRVRASRTYEGTNAVFQNTIELGYEMLAEAGISKEQLLGVGVAAPGPLDYKTGLIIDVPMMGWKNFPLGDMLRQEFGVPVRVENDGNLGALAEATLGVAKGEEVVLYQTISTGCGGGIVINGKVVHGKHGFAGEFGHETVNFAGPECGCGGNGCYELYASGTALIRRMKRDIRCGIKSIAFEAINYDPNKLNGKVLADAAAQNDPYAISMFVQEGYYIGVGLSNLINLFDPSAIVLAGGIVKAHDYFWESMMGEIKRRACFGIEDNLIRISELNDKVVSYGALVNIKDGIENGM